MPHPSHNDIRTWSIRLSVAVSFVAMTIFGVWAVPQFSKSWKISRSAKLLRDHRHEDAKELLQSLRSKFPRDPVVLLRLARVYRRLGEFENMTTILREASKCGAPSRAIELESTLANAQVGHLSEVGRRFTELLMNPGDDGPDICEAYVNGYFLLHNVDFAFRIIEAWKADYPQDPQPFFFAGVFFDQLGISSKSVPELKRALELAPHRNDIRIRLAKQLFDIQENEQAAIEARIVLKTETANPNAKVILAKCLNVNGKPEEAIRSLEQAISASPKSVEAFSTLGQLQLETHQYGPAVRSLERAVELKPFDSGLRYSLANALVATGQHEQAKPHFQAVSAAKLQLATINQLKDAVAKTPDSADLRYEIGWRLLKFDDPVQGEMWLRGALEIEPNHEKSRNALIEHYQLTGKPGLARLYSADK